MEILQEERREIMAKKYYAVRKGKTPGIYFNWEDCKKNVMGFPGASYKGFESLQEAEAFVNGGSGKTHAKIGTTEMAENEAAQKADAPGKSDSCGEVNTEKAVAYVDGSYNVATKEYSYGAVIFYNGGEEHFSEKFSNDERASMRNVAGEIEGSMCAMRYCMTHGIPALDIYYDYEGIEKWCTGEWKANKEGTIAYREFYQKASEQLKVRFVKVKGHSGDKYNDLADRLAKEAVGNL